MACVSIMMGDDPAPRTKSRPIPRVERWLTVERFNHDMDHMSMRKHSHDLYDGYLMKHGTSDWHIPEFVSELHYKD